MHVNVCACTWVNMMTYTFNEYEKVTDKMLIRSTQTPCELRRKSQLQQKHITPVPRPRTFALSQQTPEEQFTIKLKVQPHAIHFVRTFKRNAGMQDIHIVSIRRQLHIMPKWTGAKQRSNKECASEEWNATHQQNFFKGQK